MLSQIPFIYVNLLALCSFLLMFTAFAASKKTPVIRVFMVVLGDCILWSGSCVLMRLQMWPSMHRLRGLRGALSHEQHRHSGGEARLGHGLHPLHGLPLLLPEGGHRVRKEEPGQAPLPL